MSIAGFRSGGIVALVAAVAGFASFPAEAATIQLAEAEYLDETSASDGHGLQITPHGDLSISGIDVYARIAGELETEMRIFERQPEDGLPGLQVDQAAMTYTTNAEWAWINFAFDYTFEAGTSYVLYWWTPGGTLPSLAKEFHDEPKELDLLTIDYGVSRTIFGGEPTPPAGAPNDTNIFMPAFRLVIPEPGTAALVLLGASLTMLRRRRIKVTAGSR